MSDYVPEELLFKEILLRLPVKTLARFRCVSKSWKAQIDNPKFVKMHYDRTKNSDSAEERLLVGGFDYGAFKLYSINFHDSFSFDPDEICRRRAKEIKISHKLRHNCGCQMLGSCNGLVCLGILSPFAPSALIFMNPFNQKQWDLPQFPRCYSGGRGTRYAYGFGYNEVTDDYILVVLVENPFVTVVVYSLKSNSWRIVLDFPFQGMTASGDQRIGVFAGKALHWVMRDQKSYDTFIAAFDLQTEQFYRMQLPEYFSGSSFMRINLGNLGGHLSAVFHRRYGNSLVDLWVMNEYGAADSWTEKLTLRMAIYGPKYSVVPVGLLKNYHYQVVLQVRSDSFRRHSDNIFLYNLDTQSVWLLRNPTAFYNLAAYVCCGSLCVPSCSGGERRMSSFRWSWPVHDENKSMEESVLDYIAGAARQK